MIEAASRFPPACRARAGGQPPLLTCPSSLRRKREAWTLGSPHALGLFLWGEALRWGGLKGTKMTTTNRIGGVPSILRQSLLSRGWWEFCLFRRPENCRIFFPHQDWDWTRKLLVTFLPARGERKSCRSGSICPAHVNAQMPGVNAHHGFRAFFVQDLRLWRVRVGESLAWKHQKKLGLEPGEDEAPELWTNQNMAAGVPPKLFYMWPWVKIQIVPPENIPIQPLK